MRKHNRKFATSWGSAAVNPAVPAMAHSIANSKPFQLAANSILSRWFKPAKVTV